MPDNRKTALFYNFITNSMASADADEASLENPRLFQQISKSYEKALLIQDFKYFSFDLLERRKTEGDEIAEKSVIISDINYQTNLLFGSIGIAEKSVPGMIRQRDMRTMQVEEIHSPSPSIKYEAYTYFAINERTRKLVIIKNVNLPTYIHNLIAKILTTVLGSEIFYFEVEYFSEKSLRQRLHDLNKSKFEVSFALTDRVLSDKPSAKELYRKTNNSGTCKVYFGGSFKSKLTDDDIDDLLELSVDDDCKILKVYDAESNEKKDAIDLINDNYVERKKILIAKAELHDKAVMLEKLRLLLT